jgi:hypothetical protein
MALLEVRSRECREIARAPLLFTFSDRAKLKVILSLLHLCALVLLFGGRYFRYVKVLHRRLVIACLYLFVVLTVAEFHLECRLFPLLCLLGVSGLIHLSYFLIDGPTLILNFRRCHPVCLTWKFRLEIPPTRLAEEYVAYAEADRYQNPKRDGKLHHDIRFSKIDSAQHAILSFHHWAPFIGQVFAQLTLSWLDTEGFGQVRAWLTWVVSWTIIKVGRANSHHVDQGLVILLKHKVMPTGRQWYWGRIFSR